MFKLEGTGKTEKRRGLSLSRLLCHFQLSFMISLLIFANVTSFHSLWWLFRWIWTKQLQPLHRYSIPWHPHVVFIWEGAVLVYSWSFTPFVRFLLWIKQSDELQGWEIPSTLVVNLRWFPSNQNDLLFIECHPKYQPATLQVAKKRALRSDGRQTFGHHKTWLDYKEKAGGVGEKVTTLRR